MKIVSIETWSTPALCFVNANFDNGIRGLGQTAPYHADISAMVMHKQIAPLAIGNELPSDAGEIADLGIKILKDPLMAGSPGGLCEKIAVKNYKHFGSHLFRTLSGLELAMWDALGKAAGKPVYSLLGAKRNSVSVYGSSMDYNMPEEEEAARMKGFYEAGYGAFKLHCGRPNSGDNADSRPGRTEKVVKLVREAIGNAELYMDVNGNYTPDFAVKRIPFLEEHGVSILEEPCYYWEVEQTREVYKASRNTGVRVAGGEQDYMLPQWRRYCDPAAVDIIQPDVCYIGGLSRCLAVAQMAKAKGILTTTHTANRSMLPLFSSHYLCSVENYFEYMEYSIEKEPWNENLIIDYPEVKNGKLMLTEKPGWGVLINPGWLKKAQYQITK